MGTNRGHTVTTGDCSIGESVVLTCDTRGDARASWGVAIFAVALAGYGAHQVSLKPMDWSRDGPILAAFIWVFPAIAAGLTLCAVWTTLRWRKHGRTLLEVAVRARSSRKNFAAVAYSSSHASPRGPATVTLERLRTRQVRPGGKNRTRTDSTWKSSQLVEADPRAIGRPGSAAGDSRVYAIQCDVPPATPGSAKGANESIHWTLTLTVPTDGVDLVARFDVPEYLVCGSADDAEHETR